LVVEFFLLVVSTTLSDGFLRTFNTEPPQQFNNWRSTLSCVHSLWILGCVQNQ